MLGPVNGIAGKQPFPGSLQRTMLVKNLIGITNLSEINVTVHYEYKRYGVCNVFMANEPLAGKRMIIVTTRQTKQDWSLFIAEIEQCYRDAEKITLVMDNLNTHKPGSLYEAFPPDRAKKLWDRFDFVYTPKHGSWLNMAEIELNVLIRQCLNRRIADITTVATEIQAWQNHRNTQNATINWRFTTKDARIKLKRLYPTLHL